MTLFRKVAVAAVVVLAINGPMIAIAASASAHHGHRTIGPSGITDTCPGDQHEGDYCERTSGDCHLRAWVPNVSTSDPLNDRIHAASRIACDTGKDRLHDGAAVLVRYDCEWGGIQAGWLCSSPVTLQSTFEHRWCGYWPTHSDSPSCDYIADGYNYVANNFFYDVVDGSSCHGFTQQVNGTFTSANGVTHIFPEVDSAAVLYGAPSHGRNCVGVVLQ